MTIGGGYPKYKRGDAGYLTGVKNLIYILLLVNIDIH
jgi:hypothetical protein